MTALQELARANILFLNWRDRAHPQAGGAEEYCYETARRFSDAGAHVTVFTARHPGSAPRAVIDEVRILRGGGTFGVYAAAARHMLRHRYAYDAVIDCANGIPFFSPLFTPRWTADICVLHHVHQSQFDLLGPPLNVVGRVLEKQVSRVVYRGRPVVVVSPSTLEGIRRELGFRNPVYIVPNGSSPVAAGASYAAAVAEVAGATVVAGARATPLPPASGEPDTPRTALSPPRSTAPTIAVVSRLVPQKRLDLLIRAMPELTCKVPGVRLDIGGVGRELPHLRELAQRIGVSDVVAFHGRVSEQHKRELLARAWLTIAPSVAEGWGLTVIEANAVGTPAVAYDVPGLRDSVRHGDTGWLLPPDADLASGVAGALRELADPAVRERTAVRCRSWAAAFSWDDSAERLAAVVLEEMWRTRRHRRSRRRPSDLTVVGRFRVADGNAMEHILQRTLRLTDAWARRGDTFRVLLHGCDEVRALRVLRRLGVRASALTLASRQDVLVGTGGPVGLDTHGTSVPARTGVPRGEPDPFGESGTPQGRTDLSPGDPGTSLSGSDETPP